MEELLIREVTNILKRDKNIILAYLFGSSVKGEAPRFKDIDIAVLLKRERRGLKKLEFINSLSSKMEKITKCPVDVVILNHAPVALKQQIIKYGRLLFEKKKRLAHKLVVDTITAYLDYLNILNFFHSRAIQGRSRG